MKLEQVFHLSVDSYTNLILDGSACFKQMLFVGHSVPNHPPKKRY